MPEAESAIKGVIETATSNLSSATAVWATLAPQDAVKPFVTYTVLGELPVNVMGGETVPTTCDFAINIYADTFLEVVNIGDDMRAAFLRYSGTINSVVVQDVFYEGRNDFYDEDDRNYHRTMDFKMFYNEV